MLKDLIPAKYRKKVYALVTLGAAVFGAWQASAGNWEVFTAAVITVLTTSLATANTDTPVERGEDGASAMTVAVVLGIIALALYILASLGHPVRV